MMEWLAKSPDPETRFQKYSEYQSMMNVPTSLKANITAARLKNDTPILPINFGGEQMRPNTTHHLQRHQRGSVRPVHLMRVHPQTGNAAASPVDARALQISIEALFVSICQKKHYLYRQNDRNKRRLRISQKKRLLEEIQRFNQQPDGYPNGFIEDGSKGLISLLKRRLQDLRLKQQTVACTYRGMVEEEEGEMDEEMDWQRDISSENEDEDDKDAEVGTQVI
ncbi:unnamed protein product [Leuciscus chuanchicus]